MVVRFPDGVVIETGHGQDDARIHVGQGLLDGVPALQDGDVGRQPVVQKGVSTGAEAHVRDRIAVVIVLAGGVDDQFGLEIFQDRQDCILQGIQKPLVGRPGWQGDVDRIPEGVRSSHILREARTRVQRPAVLVDGDAEGVRVVPVNILGPVAVVTIGVDNGDFPDAVMLPDVFHHDGLDVDVAEPPGAVHDQHGVMARRPNEGEGVVDFFPQDFVGRGDGSAGGNQVGFGDDGAGVGYANVGPVDVLDGGQARFELDDVFEIEETLFEDLVLRIEEPFFALRVSGGNGPVEGGEKDEPRFSRFLRHDFPPAARPAINPGLTCTLTRMFFPVV